MAATEPTFTSVVRAAAVGAEQQVKAFVDKDKQCLFETDEFGDTALHVAAHEGHIKLTRYLLKSGANVNQQNKVGSTPLHKAAAKGHIAVSEILLEHNADSNIKNSSGLLPEDLAGNRHKLRVLLQGKDAVKVEFPVPKDRHGLIIGKVGKTLEELRAETKTNISVPPADNQSNHITIEGRKGGVELAKQKITELLKAAEERDAAKRAEDERRKKESDERKKQREDEKKVKEEERKKREENYTTASINVAKDRHGVIIGAGGGMIKELQASGVKITIPPRDSADTHVTIYGEMDAVENAIKKIVEITTRRPQQNNFRRQYNGDESPKPDHDSADDAPRNNRRNNRGDVDAATTTTTTTEQPADKPRQRAPKKDNTADNAAAKDSASEQPTNTTDKPKPAPKKKPNKD